MPERSETLKKMPNSADLISGMLAATCALASTNPEQFLDELDWSVAETLDAIDCPALQDGFATSFHDKAWYESWLSTMGKNARLCILVGQFANTPLIVFPLCLQKSWNHTKASFIAGDVSDYNHPLVHKMLAGHASSEFYQAMWCKIGSLIPDADILSLRKLLHDPGPGCGKAIWYPSRIEAESSHHTNLGGEWSENQGRFFGKSSRKSLQRKEKKLSQAGDISYRNIQGKAARTNAIKTLSVWKSLQLRNLGLVNPFISGDFQRFLGQIVQSGNADTYRIYGMYAGDTPLALTLMICHGDRWFLYQTAYTSEEAGKYSPGLSLLREILRRAHDEGCKVFDFGLGNEGYKKKYCDKNLELYRSEMALTKTGWIAKAYFDGALATRRLVKSNKKIEAGALSMLQLLANLRRPKQQA